MDVMPEESIDKIFDCLESWYGERFKRLIKTSYDKSLLKTMWFNGLNGLTEQQLRAGLLTCKRLAKQPDSKPPGLVLFYHYCLKISHEVPRRTWKKK